MTEGYHDSCSRGRRAAIVHHPTTCSTWFRHDKARATPLWHLWDIVEVTRCSTVGHGRHYGQIGMAKEINLLASITPITHYQHPTATTVQHYYDSKSGLTFIDSSSICLPKSAFPCSPVITYWAGFFRSPNFLLSPNPGWPKTQHRGFLHDWTSALIVLLDALNQPVHHLEWIRPSDWSAFWSFLLP